MDAPEAQEPAPNPLRKLAIELGPLLVFFVGNAAKDIYWGTGAFMVAIAVALAVSWKLERRLPAMSVISAVVVLIFGGLTIVLKDELFIKLKPTIVSLLMASVLFVGLMRGQSYLKLVMGMQLPLTDEGWRLLTRRWAFFFIVLAVLNELVWRNVDTDTWVKFKVFGIVGLSLGFGLAQHGLLSRHTIEDDESEKSDEPGATG